MGCLVGRSWTNDGLIGRCSTGDSLIGRCTVSDGLVGGGAVSNGLKGKALINPGLTGRVGVICAIAEDNYLFVESADVVWLTPENAFENELSVYSNTDWNII